MQPLTEEQIRSSFVNASNDAIVRMPLPGLHETVWAEREYLGWLDPTFAQRGYMSSIRWAILGVANSTSDKRKQDFMGAAYSGRCALF